MRAAKQFVGRAFH